MSIDISTFVIILSVVILIITLILLDGGKSKIKQSDIVKLRNDLYKIRKSVESVRLSDSERRDLVIRADNTFVHLLQKKCSNKSTFSENFKIYKVKFTKEIYNSVWEAHKIRNRTVHENYTPSMKELSFVVTTFINASNKLI